jgi:transposase
MKPISPGMPPGHFSPEVEAERPEVIEFGRSSERLTRQIEQLELRLEKLEAGEAEEISKAAAEDRPLPIREGARPKRNKLPDELPRQEVVHEPDHDGACTCPACGGDMASLGVHVGGSASGSFAGRPFQ